MLREHAPVPPVARPELDVACDLHVGLFEEGLESVTGEQARILRAPAEAHQTRVARDGPAYFRTHPGAVAGQLQLDRVCAAFLRGANGPLDVDEARRGDRDRGRATRRR